MTSLNPREQDRIMNELLEKFRRETLEREEASKLRTILEQRKEEAFNAKDIALAIGFAFLLAGLIGYIAEKVDIFDNAGGVTDRVSTKKTRRR